MIIGIDPGKTGGIAWLGPNYTLQHGMRMPMIKHGNRDMVDIRALDAAYDNLPDPDRIVVEAVNAMPKQGVSSSFNFGRFAGAVESWALSFGCPVDLVSPAKWKKALQLSSSKRQSLDMARIKFGADPMWDVLANDGIAEAALLALYSLRQHE